MTESPREFLDRWLNAINTQDKHAMAAMTHPDFIDEIPQSGERTRGMANLFAILDNYPRFDEMRNNISETEVIGAEERLVITPSFRVVQVVGQAEMYTVTARARYPDGSHWYMIIIARMKDGLIHRTTSFYAPEFPAPEWRSRWVERMERPPESS